MRIPCPLCGERDSAEFSYLGDAGVTRPSDPQAEPAAMFDYVYVRDNPAGPLREYWYHGAGCHAWLVVTRDTRSHAIAGAELAASARIGSKKVGSAKVGSAGAGERA